MRCKGTTFFAYMQIFIEKSAFWALFSVVFVIFVIFVIFANYANYANYATLNGSRRTGLPLASSTKPSWS